MYTTVGLDLSLRETGIAILKNGKTLLTGTVKSKPEGDRPIDELERILGIVEEIEVMISDAVFDNVDMVVIENLAFGVRNATSLTQLAALNYFVREMCQRNGWPFILVAPTTLKKFVTGKGNAEKSLMLLSVYRKWGQPLTNDNMADAFALAKIGELFKKGVDLTSIEKDIIKLLKVQL